MNLHRKNLQYFLVLLLYFIPCASAQSLQVSVAISLKEAAMQIAQSFREQAGNGSDEIHFTFGSSGQLATQIRNGAQVDLFISASTRQTDDLSKEQLVDAKSLQIVARNRLVLVVPRHALDVPDSFEALTNEKFKRISIGDPQTVPAGEYAMQVLVALKCVDKQRLVYGSNVRQVLSYVENDEVSAGIVYRTDAMVSGDKVKIVATAAEQTHKPIVYPAALVTTSKHRKIALKFLEYFQSDQARAILSKQGFIVDPPLTASTTQPISNN